MNNVVVAIGGGGPFSDCSQLGTVTFETGTTKVVDSLFDNCTGLVEITIPDTVTAIEDGAFNNCPNLERVSIPDTVTVIGMYSFGNCKKLSSIKLPKNLVTLGYRAFGNCTSLTSIEIPKSLNNVVVAIGGGGPFSDCSQLGTVTFETGTTKVVDSLFDNCTGLVEITIPDTVTAIEDGAFNNCPNLERVTIPETVAQIGYDAFAGCKQLQSIKIPNAKAVLGSSVFYGCSSLASAELPEELTAIPSNTFSECTSLSTFKIPERVTEIRSEAFRSSGVTSIEVPGAVIAIRENAFRDCAALASVTFNNGLTTIGNYAFYGCDALASITLPNTVASIGQYCFAESDALADVKLSTEITEIPAYAFHQCQSLKSIILPYRVKKIGSHAFTNNTNLAQITIPRAVTAIANDAFSYPEKMKIRGLEGSYAQEYAKAKGIAFEGISQPAQTAVFDKEELKIYRGASQKLILSIEPMDFTDEVGWKSSDAGIATVDESGVVKGVAVGTTTIKATVGAISVSCEVTVEQPATGLYLNETKLTLDALSQEQLTVRVNPDNAANKEVQWSSSNEAVATVDGSGLVKAIGKGTADITVKALGADRELTAKCTVTVTGNAHIVESVDAFESAHNYEAGTSDIWIYTAPEMPDALDVTFDERTNVEDGFDYLYIYDGSGKEIGSYTGTALAGQTVTVPGDTVKVKLASDKGGTDWGFKVSGIVPVDLSKPQHEIAGSNAYNVTYGDAPFALDAVLAVGDGELSYASDNTAVAAVDAGGNVEIMGAGSATVTVTAQATENYRAARMAVAIHVAKAGQGMALSYTGGAIHVGETLQITVTSAVGDVTFASDNPDVADVDAQGLVTAKAVGYANITVRAAGDANHEEATQVVELAVLAPGQDAGPNGQQKPGGDQAPGGQQTPGGNQTPGGQPATDVDLANCQVVLSQTEYVYDGAAKTPEVTVSHGGTALTRGTHYEVAYENNVEPGEALARVSAIPGSGYAGTVTRAFAIRKALASDATEVEAYAFSDCDTLYNVRFQDTITRIGDHAFANCGNLRELYFYGHAPEIAATAFANVTATAYYPGADATWTLEKLQNYGGAITWVPWDAATGAPTGRSLSNCAMQVIAGAYTYDGQEKKPAAAVTDGAKVLAEGTDYTLAYANNVNAGTANVVATGMGAYEGTLAAAFAIEKATPELAFAQGSLDKSQGDTFSCALQTKKTDGSVFYYSDNAQVVKISPVTASSDIQKTYAKKAQTAKIGASAAGGAKLTYKSSNKNVKVDASGKVTIAKKFLGTAKITIRSQETAAYLAASRTITVKVVPKGVSLKKLRNDAGRKLTVTWKKNSDVTGYELQYATNKKFQSGKKTKAVKKKATTSLRLSGLKKGKTYYVRIRTYKTVGGKKIYSAWSAAKSVKIKK